MKELTRERDLAKSGLPGKGVADTEWSLNPTTTI